jgi:hypothetical protein
MLVRKIRAEWVERTVLTPEFVRSSRAPAGRKLAFRRIDELGKRWLRVVYEENGLEIVVVSLCVDHNAEKWR